MKKKIESLIKKLSTSNNVSNLSMHFDYIKIDTTCLINYCDEYLVLYAKFLDDGILITDLNGIFEDAMLNNVSIEEFKYLLTKNRLNFDEKSTYAVVDIDNLEKTIQDFVNFIKDLNL